MSIRLKKIVVGFEVGPLAEPALRHAADLAGRFGSEIILVHVVEDPGFLSTLPPGMEGYTAGPSIAAQESHARREADRLLARFGITARMVVATGKPFTEILRVAREETADLIVVGTHGRNALAQVLLGSTAELVVRHAPCPVLTVRREQDPVASP